MNNYLALFCSVAAALLYAGQVHLVAYGNTRDTCCIVRYDSTLQPITGEYTIAEQAIRDSISLLVGQRILPTAYSETIAEIANGELSAMKAVLQYACDQFQCNDALREVLAIVERVENDVQLSQLSFVDSSNADGRLYITEYQCIVADFVDNTNRNLVYRIYYDTGDLGGIVGVLYMEDTAVLKYYVDDYNNFDQNIFWRDTLCFQLHIHQEDMGSYDKPSYVRFNKAFLK